MAVRDHGQPELVKDQQLLGKRFFTDNAGQPLDNLVDLRRVYRADLEQMNLIGLEPPLRIQRKPDVGKAKELLVVLRGCAGRRSFGAPAVSVGE